MPPSPRSKPLEKTRGNTQVLEFPTRYSHIYTTFVSNRQDGTIRHRKLQSKGTTPPSPKIIV